MQARGSASLQHAVACGRELRVLEWRRVCAEALRAENVRLWRVLEAALGLRARPGGLPRLNEGPAGRAARLAAALRERADLAAQLAAMQVT
jgi:hypothetical protein